MKVLILFIKNGERLVFGFVLVIVKANMFLYLNQNHLFEDKLFVLNLLQKTGKRRLELNKPTQDLVVQWYYLLGKGRSAVRLEWRGRRVQGP